MAEWLGYCSQRCEVCLFSLLKCKLHWIWTKEFKLCENEILIHVDFWSKIELNPFCFQFNLFFCRKAEITSYCRHVCYCRTVMVLFTRSKTQHLDKLWSSKLTFVNDDWIQFFFLITVFFWWNVYVTSVLGDTHMCRSDFWTNAFCSRMQL